jgi:hypothetical protein
VVAKQAGTELVFPLRAGDLMTLAASRLPKLNPPGTSPRREHAIRILGADIHFGYENSTSSFVITASHSPDLTAPYAENWLCEPLQIIFGQLIQPRLVARNFGDGSALVQVRRVPDIIRGARWAALWERTDIAEEYSALWLRYAEILTLVARARNFEPHKITRLYQEIIQAALGSRWVWALTFASSIEALSKMLISKDREPTSSEAEAVEIVVKHINAGPGDPRLKAIAVNAVHRTAEITTIRALRDLKAAGVVTEGELSAWKKIRDEVMHGSLVSPYSNAEDDERLMSLAAMMHALTREILRRTVTAPAVE